MQDEDLLSLLDASEPIQNFEAMHGPSTGPNSTSPHQDSDYDLLCDLDRQEYGNNVGPSSVHRTSAACPSGETMAPPPNHPEETIMEETDGDLAILRALEMTQTQGAEGGARFGHPQRDEEGGPDLDDLDDYLETKQCQESHWAGEPGGSGRVWVHPDDEFDEMDEDGKGKKRQREAREAPLIGSDVGVHLRGQTGAAKRRRDDGLTAVDILRELEGVEEEGLGDKSKWQAKEAALAEEERMKEAKRWAEEQTRRLLIPRFDALEVPGRYVPVTSAATGSRVYCHLGDRVIASSMHNQGEGRGAPGFVGPEGLDLGSRLDPPGMKMLERSVTEMLREIDEEGIQRALAASRELAESLNRHLADDDMDQGIGGEVVLEPKTIDDDHCSDSKLWVNKYAPRSFLGLLSDEAINREVAKWVMSWDKQGGARRNPQGQGQGGNKGEQGTGGGVQGQSLRDDPSGGAHGVLQGPRAPLKQDKVLLISGPPGLGKTTLAHVVAAHCGYHPYEINASDDRSAASLTERINDAVQMRSVMGSKGRPNLVIVDEIDGATGGQEGSSAISALLRIVNATGGSKVGQGRGGKGGKTDEGGRSGGAEDGSDEDENGPVRSGDNQPEAPEGAGRGKKVGGSSRAKGGRGTKPTSSLPTLRRPIICICNDLYAPALRPLRDSARVLYFKAPTRDRLVQRLTQICSLEGVKADKQALQVLCDRTECDIRSCLGTLQFLSRKKGLHVNLRAIERLDIGAKDTTRNAMAVWGKILQSASKGVQGSKWDRINELWGEINSLGEHELLVDGLLENLHSVRFLDIDFKKTSKMADRLASADILMHQARHLSKYELLSYVPPLVLRCHLIAAQPEKIRGGIVWPKAGGDNYRRGVAARETLRVWASSASPSVAQCYTRESLLLEILPALKFLLAPPLRPVAPHHLTPGEAGLLESTVNILLGYGLSYDFDVAAAQEDVLPSWALSHPSKSLGGHSIRPNPLRPAVDVLHEYGQASTKQAAHGKGIDSTLGGRVVPKAVPLVVRQMITQRATQEAIQRAEAMRNPPGLCGFTFAGMGDVPMTRGEKHRGEDPSHALKAPNPPPPHRQRKQNWLEEMRNSVGRLSSRRAQAQDQHGVGEPTSPATADRMSLNKGGKELPSSQFKVLYRYNEGYTNAVKKPLLGRDC